MRRKLKAEHLESRNLLASLVGDAFDLSEDQFVVVGVDNGVLSNDTLDSLEDSAQVVQGPDHGRLMLSKDGGFGYRPDRDFNGVDSFVYTTNGVDFAEVTLTVAPQVDLGVDDTYTVDANDTLVVDAENGVLANDLAAEAIVTPMTSPTRGELTWNLDGSFTYVSNGTVGGDSFEYAGVTPDGERFSGVVNIVVAEVDEVVDPPVDAVDDSFELDEDTEVSGNVTDNDVFGGEVVVSLETTVENGVLELLEDGTFLYTPNENFNGSDSFTYLLSGHNCTEDVGIVTLTVNPVNDAPVSVGENFVAVEDETVEVVGLLDNDFDVDGDVLTTVLVDAPVNGSVVLNADGSFSYTGNQDFNGVDTFTYVVNDGELDSNLATVTVEVTPVNDAPVAAVDVFNINVGEVLLGNALDNDLDVDGDTLRSVLRTFPENGDLFFNEVGQLAYTPNFDFIGTDSFEYLVFDDEESVVGEVLINVLDPLAVDEALTV